LRFLKFDPTGLYILGYINSISKLKNFYKN